MPNIRMEAAFSLFDAFNQQDPNTVNVNGVEWPATYFHAVQLHRWVLRLVPDASEPLLLASRSQHIGRWRLPRSEYPAGRPGYLQWRTTLARFHAQTAAELLQTAGYTTDETIPVQQIILKKDLRTNPEVQAMENGLCLVFLEFQFEDFLHQHDEPTVLRVLRKTWGKMTEPGREAAMRLTFSVRARELLAAALAA